MRSDFKNDSYGFLLGVTYRKASQLFLSRLKDFEITPEQWVVLNCLRFEDGISQKEISVRSEKDQATTTRILDSLISKGLIKKNNCTKDRRVSIVHITEKGVETLKQTSPIEKMLWEDLTMDFTNEERQIFKNLLNKINTNITKRGETDGR